MKKVLIVLTVISGLMFGQNSTNSVLITSPAPSGVFNQFVATTGTTGQTNYCYWVVAVYPIGMAVSNGPVCQTNSNSTLDSSNYNTISWQSPSAAVTGYWVVRSTTSVFPGTGTVAVNSSVIASTTFSQTDQSNTLQSFTYTGIPFASSQFQINNRDFSLPVVQLVNNNSGNNTVTSWTETANGINHLNFLNSATTVDPAVRVGSTTDTNVAINVVPKGSGGLKVNGTTLGDSTAAVLGATYAITGSATVSQINSGIVILAAVTGRTLRVVGFEVQAIGGTFGGCTLVQVVDTAGTPIVSTSIPVATLVQNTIVTPSSANVTFTNYSWQGQLTASKGLGLNQTGSACTTATSLNYRVSYTINN